MTTAVMTKFVAPPLMEGLESRLPEPARRRLEALRDQVAELSAVSDALSGQWSEAQRERGDAVSRVRYLTGHGQQVAIDASRVPANAHPSLRDAYKLVKPATVVQWHRKGFRLYWRWRSRRPGRLKIGTEIRDLIRRMSRANPLWGAPRIHGELLKLGIKISQATVGRWMPWRPKVPSPTWRSFLHNHLPDIAAIDMFVVATATLPLGAQVPTKSRSYTIAAAHGGCNAANAHSRCNTWSDGMR